MTSPLLLMVAIMAVTVGWLFRQSIHVRPWEEASADSSDNKASGASFTTSTARIGLIVFLAVATSLFAITLSAYFIRMMQPDWNNLIFPSVVWFNTFVLFLSDIAIHRARAAARRADESHLRSWLSACAAGTVIFLVGQVWAWIQLNSSGYFSGTTDTAVNFSPANSFFYLFTILHGVHLLGGLYVLGRAMRLAWSGARLPDYLSKVDLCATYWRYLFVLWVALLIVLIPSVSQLCRTQLFT